VLLARFSVLPERIRISKADLIKLWERQNGRCAICGEKLHPYNCHVDHKRPLALGGSNSLRNLQLLCPNCHSLKTKEDIKRIARAKRKKEEDIALPMFELPNLDFLEEILGVGGSRSEKKQAKKNQSQPDFLGDVLEILGVNNKKSSKKKKKKGPFDLDIF